MFHVTDRGDVFVRPKLYDMLVAATFGVVPRAYRRAATVLAEAHPHRVLDIGTGTGAMAIAVKQRLSHAEVHAVDPGERMLDVARTNGVRAGVVVHFCHGWAQSLPFDDNEFDAVTLASTLHHIPPAQRGRVMSEVRRVLRPGAMVVIVEPMPVGVARVLPVHRHAMDVDGCRRLLRATGFEDVEFGRVTPRCFAYASARQPPPDRFPRW